MIHVRKTFGKSWLFEGWRYAWVCRGNLLIYVAIYRTERERERSKALAIHVSWGAHSIAYIVDVIYTGL